MSRTMSAEDSESFAFLSKDENCLHSNEQMWRDYGVPALVPGMQTLCTALASIDRDELFRLNYVLANFQKMIPVGSEVNFSSEKVRRGFWRGLLGKILLDDETARDIKISAYVNGSDALTDSKGEYSLASRVILKEKPFFNEGDSQLKIKIDYQDIKSFSEVTGLREEVAFPLYTLAISSSSIAHRIKNPDASSAPSWVELHNSLMAPIEKRKIPAYESLEAYFPKGLILGNAPKEVGLRSAIRKEGNVYVIDTLCDSNGERIYGVRAHLKQRRQEVIVKGIAALLDEVTKSENTGSLTDAVERRKKFVAEKDFN